MRKRLRARFFVRFGNRAGMILRAFSLSVQLMQISIFKFLRVSALLHFSFQTLVFRQRGETDNRYNRLWIINFHRIRALHG